MKLGVALRQLGVANEGGAKSMEKLSSGYRINRAGDDAAGLSISEKMRGQIRGLNQASSNAQDGISLIQTAEGALNETHAILQRMRELAVQSSTDTNTNDDRVEIQKEVDQLSQEITRIAETTQFNTMNLLDGTYKDKEFHIGANKGQSTTVAIDSMKAGSLGVKGTAYQATAVAGITGLSVTSTSGVAVSIEYKALAAATVEDAVVAGSEVAADGLKITITLGQDASANDVVGVVNTTKADIKRMLQNAAGDLGITVSSDNTFTGTDKILNASLPGTTTVGTTPDETKEVGINVSSQTTADAAIETINSAISTVSSERSKLGAMQNRLEHTIKNLDTSSENLQASTAMLAQANQAPQGVLQLLR